MDELTFLNLLSQVVEAYPKQLTNNAGFPITSQPQTFAAITNFSALNTDNYGKSERHKSKRFYFNRNPNTGVKADYPAVLIISRSDSFDFENGINTAAYTMIVEDANPIPNHAVNSNVGQSNNLRTPEEVYSDLRQIGVSILREAYDNFILAEVTPIPTPTPPAPAIYTVWANKIFLEAQQTAGKLTYKYKNTNFQEIWRNDLKGSIRLQGADNTANGTLAYIFDFTLNLNACINKIGFQYDSFNKNLTAINQTCC